MHKVLLSAVTTCLMGACSPATSDEAAVGLIGDWTCRGETEKTRSALAMSFAQDDLVMDFSAVSMIEGRRVSGTLKLLETWNLRGKRLYRKTRKEFKMTAAVNGDPVDTTRLRREIEELSSVDGYVLVDTLTDRRFDFHNLKASFTCTKLA